MWIQHRSRPRHTLSRLTIGLGCCAVLFTAPLAAAEPFFPVDLSRHVTHGLYDSLLPWPGADLAELSPSCRTEEAPRAILNGVPFRLEGVILVGPGQAEGEKRRGRVNVAEKVEGIPIGLKADRLHFLQATCLRAESGARIGAYIVHCGDGSEVEIPIRYGEDVLDWCAFPNTEAGPSRAQVVWTGSNEAFSQDERAPGIRLFLKTWKNPHPDWEIKSLDLVTGGQRGGLYAPTPFLVAMTVGVVPADGRN